MEDATSMPQNGGQEANERMETNSSGQAIHKQISSTDHLSIRIDGNLDATNGTHQGAASNIPSTSNSEITPASNNSAGTSQGQSSNPNERLESSSYSSTPKTSSSDGNAVHQGAAPKISSTSNTEIPPASNNSAGTSQGQSPSPRGDQRTLNYYGPLHQAALKGDWPAAKSFYDKDEHCVRAPIEINEARALHVAVSHQRTTFIKKWLTLMKQEDLKLQTDYGFTALHTAAQVGNVNIAKQLVSKNDELPSITDDEGDTPLTVAAYVGHTNMVSYLFSVTTLQEWTDEKCIELFHHSIYNDMFDIALKILKLVPNQGIAGTECRQEALEMLARKPFSIGSESQLSFWKSRINSC